MAATIDSAAVIVRKKQKGRAGGEKRGTGLRRRVIRRHALGTEEPMPFEKSDRCPPRSSGRAGPLFG